MHPGSGPSGRDNDVYFPPIRQHLLESGIAVSSFDKRGVGGSTGHWVEAGIERQSEDALAAVAVLGRELPGVPIGLFGHSQGGWVVIDAASRSRELAFLVTNSGPGVTPLEQERYAHRTKLLRQGVSPAEIDEAMEPFELVAAGLARRLSFEAMRIRIERAYPEHVREQLDLVLLPDDPALWPLFLEVSDYDPRPALERTRIPVLALFGAEDSIVPVEASVSAYREAVRTELLTVEVFPGGDHRIQTGHPPAFADGYLTRLTDFVLQAVA
jgi:pimeloyl-ACP methyl ester carboxylesterase